MMKPGSINGGARKSRWIKRQVAAMGLALMGLVGTANAWQPAGWSWWSGSYAIEYDTGAMHWINAKNTQWTYGLPPAKGWQKLADSSLFSGWSWWSWPYAYDLEAGAWFYVNEGDTQWCVNLDSGTWSRLGTAVASTLARTRINSGGGAFTDSGGNAWVADTGFDAGTVQTTASAISGTANPVLYQSARIGPQAYRLPIARGMVEVVLHFAEYTAQSSNTRVFDVSIDGIRVAQNVDIFHEAGGRFRALTKTVTAFVDDGTMDLVFTGVVGAPTISAIDAKPIPSLDASPPAITFADTGLGSTSTAEELTMINIGSLQVHVKAIRFVGLHPGDFQAVGFRPVYLEPGATAPAYVVFAPTAVGARQASLVFDTQNAVHYVPLTGQGVAGGQ